MGEHTAFVLVMFFKTVMVVSAIAASAYLAFHDKPGWGWLIFVTIILACVSIRVGDDTDDADKKEEKPNPVIYKQT